MGSCIIAPACLSDEKPYIIIMKIQLFFVSLFLFCASFLYARDAELNTYQRELARALVGKSGTALLWLIAIWGNIMLIAGRTVHSIIVKKDWNMPELTCRSLILLY